MKLVQIGKLQDGNDNKDIFYKCVHFFGEIGAFIYYSNDNSPKAIISFIKYCHGSNSITPYYNNITFTNYSFYYDIILNDVIKVSDKIIFFVALSFNKYDLFIITLNNYYQDKIIFRKYKTYSFLYSCHYFYNTIRLEIYNNFLTLGANGFGNNGTSFSSLTIFSYPNSSDINKTIIGLLLNDNKIKIKNIKLEIKNLCKIENNMFGLIQTGIKIDEIYKITNEYLSLDDGTKISSNIIIDISETLKLNIPKTDNIYKEFIYGMKYVCQAKEPEFEKYNKYPIEVNDTGMPNNAIDYFERKEYFGRHSYYYFILDNKLTEEDCKENCELCYNNDKNKCVTCIYNNFEITGGSKNCNELLITTILETTLPIETTLKIETSMQIVTTRATLIETTVQKYQNIISFSEIFTIKEII